jgi:hypothetical protein
MHTLFELLVLWWLEFVCGCAFAQPRSEWKPEKEGNFEVYIAVLKCLEEEMVWYLAIRIFSFLRAMDVR